jgi:hypothetical protein
MSVRTRKNAIVLAAGAILALAMPLTSITPASADSVLTAAVGRTGAVNHAAALHKPIASGTQELTLRMVGSSPYFAAGPVYRHSIRTTLPVYANTRSGNVPMAFTSSSFPFAPFK